VNNLHAPEGLTQDSRALLAVCAHPDDETFRCGGTLALLARRGVRVQVLCATRGEAGVPGLNAQQAGFLRQAELECACRALGIAPPLFLDHRDGTLSHVHEQQAVAEIETVMQPLQPQVLLTWPPDGLSGHLDHIAVSRWTGLALERAAARGERVALYHIVLPQSVARVLQMPHLHAVPDEQVTLTVDVSAVWEQKLAAIACHRTQAGASPILTAPAERQRLFLGREHFRRAVTTEWPDLLVALREKGGNVGRHQRVLPSKP
jgi:LmbE family N-acetylglucosaminyl deacetylase